MSDFESHTVRLGALFFQKNYPCLDLTFSRSHFCPLSENNDFNFFYRALFSKNEILIFTYSRHTRQEEVTNGKKSNNIVLYTIGCRKSCWIRIWWSFNSHSMFLYKICVYILLTVKYRFFIWIDHWPSLPCS